MEIREAGLAFESKSPKMGHFNQRVFPYTHVLVFCLLGAHLCSSLQHKPPPLRFKPDGRFKILQIADMHYANGATTKCKDVLPTQYKSCSDLNTTTFVKRLIAAEKPDLIVFSGDNIFGQDTIDPIASLNDAFAPAIEARVPWAAILGNHDQESTLSRLEVMEHIAKMDYTLSQVYPQGSNSSMVEVDGFGNYHLEVEGAKGSPFEETSVLNIYMLDSGDYSKVKKVHGYGWIQESQKKWFKELSTKLKEEFQSKANGKNDVVPTLVYFHIPLVETRIASRCYITGVKQEGIGCAQVNSGFLATMSEVGDPHVVFNGHDHVNDFCGDLSSNIKVCYGGGVGYHAYGKAGWSRRARVVDVSLRNLSSTIHTNATSKLENLSTLATQEPQWLLVDNILTWKRLDLPSLPVIDHEVLWSYSLLSSTSHQWWWNLQTSSLLSLTLVYFFLCLLLSYSMSWWPFNGTFMPLSTTQRRLTHFLKA